jgi:hypothetical protein
MWYIERESTYTQGYHLIFLHIIKIYIFHNDSNNIFLHLDVDIFYTLSQSL